MEFITIYIKEKEQEIKKFLLPNDPSYSLMELMRAVELPVPGTCGGIALCASCHIYVLSEHNLSIANEEEISLLDSLPNSKNNSRLSCQLRINESLNNLIIEIAG
jgi:2Fe-2S ferredoxin